MIPYTWDMIKAAMERFVTVDTPLGSIIAYLVAILLGANLVRSVLNLFSPNRVELDFPDDNDNDNY